MHYYPGENWYAIRVRFRHEHVVEKALANKDFCPLNLEYKVKSKRKDRQKILTKAFFPGYMFLKAELNPANHLEILKSLGVIEILHNSQGPLPIPEDQIQNVLQLKKYEGEILTFKEFASGMPVRIVEGPLAGVIGRIDEIQRDLVKISIDSIPGAVAVQVSAEQIEPIDSNHSLSSLLRLES